MKGRSRINANEIVEVARKCVERDCGKCQRLYNDIPSEYDCRIELVKMQAEMISSMQREIKHLTAERDAEKRRADVAERGWY